ncbi:unnamed protein product, partial [Prorocentrum cordatum]
EWDEPLVPDELPHVADGRGAALLSEATGSTGLSDQVLLAPAQQRQPQKVGADDVLSDLSPRDAYHSAVALMWNYQLEQAMHVLERWRHDSASGGTRQRSPSAPRCA